MQNLIANYLSWGLYAKTGFWFGLLEGLPAFGIFFYLCWLKICGFVSGTDVGTPKHMRYFWLFSSPNERFQHLSEEDVLAWFALYCLYIPLILITCWVVAVPVLLGWGAILGARKIYRRRRSPHPDTRRADIDSSFSKLFPTG